MYTLGERIRRVRDEILKINQARFAGMLGFSRIATISDYEKDKRNPDITTLCKIASLGSVSLDWLLTGKGGTSGLPHGLPEERIKPAAGREGKGPLYREEYRTVEVYCMGAQASGPGEFPGGEPVEVISIPARDLKEGLVAVRVQGDSMSPTLLDSAIVGIDTTDRRLISGRLYAVWLNYEGATIKRVFAYPDRVILKPDNPTFPDTAIPTTSVGKDFIIGRVRWAYQRY